ncbi:TlpA family protein disulfide reductase [Actinopolymorpha pittospori]
MDSATTAGPDREPGPDRLVAADLGAELGHQATLVQFSSAFCAPCRATRLVLSGIAATEDGVAYIDIDAESHLDLVRRLDVVSTPTVFVLDPHGRIVIRAAGQPRRAQVTAALDRLKGMKQSCSGG